MVIRHPRATLPITIRRCTVSPFQIVENTPPIRGAAYLPDMCASEIEYALCESDQKYEKIDRRICVENSS